MKYFWREKNANKFYGKAEVIEPNRQELENELINKLNEKIERIKIVFDKKARETYFKKNKKPKKDYSTLSEVEMQREIGKNVIADFWQLLNDLKKYYNLSSSKKIPREKMQLTEIESDIKRSVEEIKHNPQIAIDTIYKTTLSLLDLLNLNLDEVEKLRKEKEKKQGSFYKGKYVILN